MRLEHGPEVDTWLEENSKLLYIPSLIGTRKGPNVYNKFLMKTDSIQIQVKLIGLRATPLNRR